MKKDKFTTTRDGQKVKADGFRVCPNCNQEKHLDEFGFRQMSDGTIRNQSWCSECRGK